MEKIYTTREIERMKNRIKKTAMGWKGPYWRIGKIHKSQKCGFRKRD